MSSESIVDDQTDVPSLVNEALRFQTYCLLKYLDFLPKIEFLHFFQQNVYIIKLQNNGN